MRGAVLQLKTHPKIGPRKSRIEVAEVLAAAYECEIGRDRYCEDGGNVISREVAADGADTMGEVVSRADTKMGLIFHNIARHIRHNFPWVDEDFQGVDEVSVTLVGSNGQGTTIHDFHKKFDDIKEEE